MEDLSQVLIAVKELLLDTPLKDKSLMAVNNPITQTLDRSYPITLPDITFTFGVGAEAGVMLFNDEDDTDPDGLLPTFNTATEAYLKYINQVSAKANGQLSLKDIGFNISAAGTAKTLYYKKHDNTFPINKAFLQDISLFKTIFRGDDVKNLEEGGALGFIVNGTLSASMKVSWSNIFSKTLSVVSKLLPIPLTLDINLTPSLTASLSISVTDDFSYVIKKETGNQCLVDISRKKSRTLSGSAGASIGVKFADSAEVTRQLTEIYDQICISVFGSSASDISDTISKWKQKISDASQNILIAKLLAYFKLDDIAGLADKLSALQTSVTSSITSIAEASVTAEFTYQYERIEENETVLSVSLPTDTLLAYHGQLLRFNPSGLLDDMRNKKISYTLHSFLEQTVLTISQSFGFGIKISDVVNLSSKDYSDQKISTQINFAGCPQIKVDYTQGYKWQLGKNKGAWLGDFSAAMPNFSATPTPYAKDFNFSLLMEMITINPNMQLQKYLDEGALWGCVREQDIAGLKQKYIALQGKSVSTDTKLSFNNNALMQLLQRIALYGWSGENIKYMALAMAASMTQLDGYQWRASPSVRQQTYYPLWLSFLTNYDPSTDISDYGAEAEAFIRKAGNADHLAEFEGNTSNWTFGDTFAGIIRSNPGVYDNLKGAVNNLIALQQMIQLQQPFDPKRLQRWLKGFMPVFSQSYYTRTLGYFLLLHASDLSLGDDIQKVMTFTIDAQVINIAAS
jgi:hypothetical protein